MSTVVSIPSHLIAIKHERQYVALLLHSGLCGEGSADTTTDNAELVARVLGEAHYTPCITHGGNLWSIAAMVLHMCNPSAPSLVP